MVKIKRFNLILLMAVLIAVVSWYGISSTKKQAQKKNEKPTEIITRNEEVKTATSSDLEIIATSTSDSLDTKDWQTYRNEEYGFEIMYPENWKLFKLSDSKAGFSLKSPTYNQLVSGQVKYNGEIYISKIINNNNLSIIDLINRFDDNSKFWPQKFSYKDEMINKNKALIFNEIKEGGYGRKEAFVQTKNYVFSITYLYEKKDSNIEKIFDQIVKNIIFFNKNKQ